MLSTKFDVGQSADLDDTPAGLPMPDATDTLATPENNVPSSPPAARHLPVPVSTVVELIDNPSETSGSDESTTGHASVMTKEAAPLTAGRMPVVISGSGKKLPQKMALTPVKRKHRVLLHAAVAIVLFMSVSIALATVLPQDGHAQGLSGLLQSFGMKQSQSGSNSAQISPEQATATAVLKDDGKDPGGGNPLAPPPANTGGPVNTGPPVNSGPNLNRFYYGQCTYYANMEYGSLTGHYVPWLGNANQWVYGARASGWKVSATPSVPAIIAFDPYVDGAGAFGHVGVTTSISGNQVTYGSWNAAGAPYATTTYLTVTAPASGVSFITYS